MHGNYQVIAPVGDPADLGKLSAWAPELARTFVALSSDIALVIDADGVIRTVAQGEAQQISREAHTWVGRSWVDTVSGDTRSKVEKLLQEAATAGIAKRREVNHTPQPGLNIPVAYTAIRLGEHGPVLAVGRDLRAIAAIQERFIESQQDLERGYWNARQAESRYRLLFQVATDGVMVVDPETLSILEANPAAGKLLGSAGQEPVGLNALTGFASSSRGAVNELLANARSTGQSGEIRARLLGSVASTSVAATSFRANGAMRLLVRIRLIDGPGQPVPVADAKGSPQVSGEGAVVTDSNGRILHANSDFLAMVELAGEADARGHALIDWLGTAEQPLNGLIAKVRREGVVGSFVTSAKPARGPAEPVEVSAMLLTEGDQECIGFTVRRARGDTSTGSALFPGLQVGLGQLAERIGDLPLASLLMEAAALTERHFIELALSRTGGDTDAAAALLGVSPSRLDPSATTEPRAGGRSNSRET